MSEEKKRIYYPLQESAVIDGVVVHCYDPRFEEAFLRFVKEELGMKHPARIEGPGGAIAIGLELLKPKHFKTLRDQVELTLELMAAHGKEQRLVLINHEGCKAYEKLLGAMVKALHQKQADDLVRAVTLFKKFIPGLSHVSVYMARLEPERPREERVYFEKVY